MAKETKKCAHTGSEDVEMDVNVTIRRVRSHFGRSSLEAPVT